MQKTRRWNILVQTSGNKFPSLSGDREEKADIVDSKYQPTKHAESVTNATVNHSTLPLTRRTKFSLLGLVLGSSIVYFFSNPNPQSHFDYTFRMAGALLHGNLGLKEQPSWLNEMVPFEGFYYSVFPLGSVLTMLPAALLREAGVIETFPAAIIGALIAGAISLFFFLLTLRYDTSWQRRWLLVLFMMFGTWMWCNLAFGGAWQIALGFAVLGQLGALCFILIQPRPLIAGLFFALAFGNRTEAILLAPVFMYLLTRRDTVRPPRKAQEHWPMLLKFSVFPFFLISATLAYNYLRFHSPFDFGYVRIPGVLEEPWYRHGIFSLYSIPLNMKAMLFEGWKVLDSYPYLVPTGFGGSIFLSSPFLVMVFRTGARDFELKVIAWIAIVLLTLVIWLHGNPGGWQFSYRYAMVLLPWMFLVLLENSPCRVSAIETALLAVSIIVNAYATYLFLWTDYIRP